MLKVTAPMTCDSAVGRISETDQGGRTIYARSVRLISTCGASSSEILVQKASCQDHDRRSQMPRRRSRAKISWARIEAIVNPLGVISEVLTFITKSNIIRVGRMPCKRQVAKGFSFLSSLDARLSCRILACSSCR